MSTAAALALLAALAALPAPQDESPLQDRPATAPSERREDIRVVIAGGPEGPGRMDADGDGSVTREEFAAPVSRAFDRLDADGDGRLTTEELAAGPGGEDHVFMLRGPHGGPGGPGPLVLPRRGPGEGAEVFVFRHGGPGGEGPRALRGPGERRVEIRRFGGPGGHGDMDANEDGRVTEDEFLAPLREAFQRMDADRDGALDDGEHRAPPPPADD